MDALCGAFVCAYPAALTILKVVGVRVLAILFCKHNRIVRTEDPASSTSAILHPEAGFISVDWSLCTPATSLVFQRITGLDNIPGHWYLVVFLTHPTFASFTALSIATLFKSPTFPGYRVRTSPMTVSTATTPVAETAAAIVGML